MPGDPGDPGGVTTFEQPWVSQIGFAGNPLV